MPWVERLVRVVVILALAWVVTRVARRLIGRLKIRAARGVSDTDFDKRAATIITVLVKLASVAIWLVALVMSLSELTFNVQPLIPYLKRIGRPRAERILQYLLSADVDLKSSSGYSDRLIMERLLLQLAGKV